MTLLGSMSFFINFFNPIIKEHNLKKKIKRRKRRRKGA
jgi:hypothetical protein